MPMHLIYLFVALQRHRRIRDYIMKLMVNTSIMKTVIHEIVV